MFYARSDLEELGIFVCLITLLYLFLLRLSEFISNSILGQVALIVGGELSGNSTSSVEVYSPDGGCQYSLSALPLALTGLTLGFSLSNILACSGFDTTTKLNNQKCWRYNFLTNNWGLLGKLSSTNQKYPAKTYNNMLYFFNDAVGEYFSSYLPMKVVPWNVKPPTPLGEGACSIMWKNKIIIFGGGTANTTVQMYDFAVTNWKTLAPMTVAHAFFGCVLLPDRNRVLIVATAPGGDERRSDMYNIATNTWNVTGSTVNARGRTSLVALGKRVFAIGGNSAPSPTSLSATVEEYDTAIGAWSLVNATLITAGMNFGVLSLPAALFSNLPLGCNGIQ